MRPVLLVEDNDVDALMVQRAFRKGEVKNALLVVDNGESAVALLSEREPRDDDSDDPLPALVLLDLKLPRLSGFEMLDWARSRPRLRGIPFVVLTSSEQDRDLARAYALGANSYLVKPVSFEGLLRTVEALDLYWLELNRAPRVAGN